GATITFDAGLSGQTITLTNGALTLRTDMAITGPGANTLAISGNNTSRVFVAELGSVAISGLTIEYGLADVGAGILAAPCCGFDVGVAVTNAIIAHNTATDSGGGIAENGTFLTLTNTAVFDNSA